MKDIRRWIIQPCIAATCVTFAFLTAGSAGCQNVVSIAGNGGAGGDGAVSSVSTSTSSSKGPVSSASGSSECAVDFDPSMGSAGEGVATGVGSTGSGFASCQFQLGNSDHLLDAQCTEKGCTCQLDGVQVCACTFDAPLTKCADCCPSPWPQ